MRTISDDPDGFGPGDVRLGTRARSKDALRKELADAVLNTGGKSVTKPKAGKTSRTSQGLRDILFDEIDQLRNGDGDPTRALAIANVAKQILNTARVELDFHRTIKKEQEEGREITLGSLKLGTDQENVASATQSATER